MYSYTLFFVLAFVIIAPNVVLSDFSLTGSNTNDFVVVNRRFLNGPYSANDGSIYLATSNIFSSANALWYNTPQQVSQGFAVSFRMWVISSGAVGSGFAFVLQSNGLTVGSSGNTFGLNGFTSSFAIVFDFSSNFVSIQVRGNTILTSVALPTSLRDQGPESYSISYTSSQLKVVANGITLFDLSVDISTYTGSTAYVGFIGSTSAAASLTIQLYDWSFQGTSTFSLTQNTNLNGFTLVDGDVFAGGNLGLTHAGNSFEAVAVYYDTPQSISNGFNSRFNFQITKGPNGVAADGFVFILSNPSQGFPIGNAGVFLGLDGLNNYLAIKFQTNTQSDLSNNSISFAGNGNVLGGNFQPKINLADGRTHSCIINFANTILSVYVDNQLQYDNSATGGVIGNVGSSTAYVGLIGTTDSATSETVVISGWTFNVGSLAALGLTTSSTSDISSSSSASIASVTSSTTAAGLSTSTRATASFASQTSSASAASAGTSSSSTAANARTSSSSSSLSLSTSNAAIALSSSINAATASTTAAASSSSSTSIGNTASRSAAVASTSSTSISASQTSSTSISASQASIGAATTSNAAVSSSSSTTLRQSTSSAANLATQTSSTSIGAASTSNGAVSSSSSTTLRQTTSTASALGATTSSTSVATSSSSSSITALSSITSGNLTASAASVSTSSSTAAASAATTSSSSSVAIASTAAATSSSSISANSQASTSSSSTAGAIATSSTSSANVAATSSSSTALASITSGNLTATASVAATTSSSTSANLQSSSSSTSANSQAATSSSSTTSDVAATSSSSTALASITSGNLTSSASVAATTSSSTSANLQSSSSSSTSSAASQAATSSSSSTLSGSSASSLGIAAALSSSTTIGTALSSLSVSTSTASTSYSLLSSSSSSTIGSSSTTGSSNTYICEPVCANTGNVTYVNPVVGKSTNLVNATVNVQGDITFGNSASLNIVKSKLMVNGSLYVNSTAFTLSVGVPPSDSDDKSAPVVVSGDVNIQGSLEVDLSSEPQSGSEVFVPIVDTPSNVVGGFNSYQLVYNGAPVSSGKYKITTQKRGFSFGVLIQFNLNDLTYNGIRIDVPPWLIVVVSVIPVICVILFVFFLARWRNKFGTAKAVARASWNLRNIHKDELRRKQEEQIEMKTPLTGPTERVMNHRISDGSETSSTMGNTSHSPGESFTISPEGERSLSA